ncbi:MAG: hypothetical protein ACI89X_003140 [Planctomycetota bacterium]|jgi:hypothetical protein
MQETSTLRALQAASVNPDSYRATRRVLSEIEAESASVNFLFVSPASDLARVSKALAEVACGPMICCTTAGEVWRAEGHIKGGIVGASLSGVRARVWPIDDLQSFSESEAKQFVAQMREFRDSIEPGEAVSAVVLLDGLSTSEERVASLLHGALDGVPIVGGAAGDDHNFESTKVLVNGAFEEGKGVVALIVTSSRTTTFMAHHFEPVGSRLVVTAADPARRRIVELDGMPAAEAYRQATGFSSGLLTREVVAASPLLLPIGGRTYVRSLVGEADGSLDLYCAIEKGLVLQVGRSTSLTRCLSSLIEDVQSKVGQPQLVVSFGCVLSSLEMAVCDRDDGVRKAFADNNFFGFRGYGQLFGGLAVNQTLTGIAFGR